MALISACSPADGVRALSPYNANAAWRLLNEDDDARTIRFAILSNTISTSGQDLQSMLCSPPRVSPISWEENCCSWCPRSNSILKAITATTDRSSFDCPVILLHRDINLQDVNLYIEDDNITMYIETALMTKLYSRKIGYTETLI